MSILLSGYNPEGIVFAADKNATIILKSDVGEKRHVEPTSTKVLAWIPILNAFLMLMIAKKSLLWFILLLIPIVNIIIAFIVWMAIAEARGKPSWVGILMIVPLVNIIIAGYPAFSQ